jgi:pimeloyl-ACP methyl ester carboxylesterase
MPTHDLEDSLESPMNASQSQRDLQANGITLRITEQGTGPLVLLCHGWPELGYSWRHQIPALAAAGYRAVAPDMRGYGRSSVPSDTAAYAITDLVGDMVALVAALGESRACIVGHDWGATVAWSAALMRPRPLHRSRCAQRASPPAKPGRAPAINVARSRHGELLLVLLRARGRP